MKIEKGKLYYDNIRKQVFIYHDGIITDNSISDKIAVHCPTNEDWEYVLKWYELAEVYLENSSDLVYYSLDDLTYGKSSDYKDDGYHLITIDQFKEFYPEDSKVESLDVDNINPTHYNSKGIQPIDYIEANNMNFNEGNVIKYVTRYKEKNGLEDLKKAKVYLQRLIDRYDKK